MELKSELGKEAHVLEEIPLEERRVIGELVEFWQNHRAPRDLVMHINRLFDTWGSGIGASFFQQVYEDLRDGKRSEYPAFSVSQFKCFLEAEYSQPDQTHAERLARLKVKEREEHERMARTDFDALGEQIAKATTRAELVTLGRKRASLAPQTGISYTYENHCWSCGKHISSAIHAQCPDCKFYICGSCSACFCGFNPLA